MNLKDNGLTMGRAREEHQRNLEEIKIINESVKYSPNKSIDRDSLRQASIDYTQTSVAYYKRSIGQESEAEEALYSSSKQRRRKLNSQGISVTGSLSLAQSVGLSKVPKIGNHEPQSNKSGSMPGSKRMSRVHSTELKGESVCKIDML